MLNQINLQDQKKFKTKKVLEKREISFSQFSQKSETGKLESSETGGGQMTF